MTFGGKLEAAQQANDSWVCVGLDPVMDRLPAEVRSADNPLFTFGQAIVEEDIRKVDRFSARYRVARAEFDDKRGDPFFNINTPDDLAEAERLSLQSWS